MAPGEAQMMDTLCRWKWTLAGPGTSAGPRPQPPSAICQGSDGHEPVTEGPGGDACRDHPRRRTTLFGGGRAGRRSARQTCEERPRQLKQVGRRSKDKFPTTVVVPWIIFLWILMIAQPACCAFFFFSIHVDYCTSCTLCTAINIVYTLLLYMLFICVVIYIGSTSHL